MLIDKINVAEWFPVESPSFQLIQLDMYGVSHCYGLSLSLLSIRRLIESHPIAHDLQSTTKLAEIRHLLINNNVTSRYIVQDLRIADL